MDVCLLTCTNKVMKATAILNDKEVVSISTGHCACRIVNREMMDTALNYLEWLRHVGARNTLFASYQSDVDATLLEWGAPCMDISDLVGIDPDGVWPFANTLHACDNLTVLWRGGGGGGPGA